MVRTNKEEESRSVKEHAIQTDLVGDVDFASVEIIDTLDYRS